VISTNLDRIDAVIALLEGPGIAALDGEGRAVRPDMTPYQPTREWGEAMRLMDKYITRLVRLSDGWAAVDRNGRAHAAPTALIAVCTAAAGTAADPDGLLDELLRLSRPQPRAEGARARTPRRSGQKKPTVLAIEHTS
jgi:hypothetical protein